MNVLEANLILGTLQSAFPSFYRGIKQKAAQDIADLWAKMFEDDDFKAVMASVQALIATRTEGYPPTIGEVKEKLAKIRGVDGLSEQEAWALVSKACQNGYYHSVEEFEKLPDVIQRSIGGPEQLKAWAQMDAATVESVVASNFMRTFKAKRKQQKELEMMPTEVKNYMAAVADKMQIGGPEHKKLEEPKQRAIEAPKLETMVLPDVKKNLPKPDLPTPKPYKAPSGADWEKKREEAMEKLNAVKKTKEASANG